jgi:threonine dehydrogenase-like Zn-dependent dehydrogenase
MQMKVSVVTGPGETQVIDVPKPTLGPADALVKIRACYLDAAGAPAVIDTALAAAKPGSRLGVVGVHKHPVPVDFVNIMSNEITIVGSAGYPNEIFDVTKDIVANWEKYTAIVSHTIPFDNVDEALRMASTPGAADKVVVTFN